MKKLKARWGIQSNIQFTIILVVFAITGTTAARCAPPIATWWGINAATTPAWLYWPLQLILIMPLYQVLLLLVGSLFGQFRFFWAFEKRMLARCGLTFAASSAASSAASGADSGGDSGAASGADSGASTRSDEPVSDDTDAAADHHAPAEKQYAEQTAD